MKKSEIKKFTKKPPVISNKVSNAPALKKEFWDGENWQNLASEWYVDQEISNINDLYWLQNCALATTANLDGSYDNGNQGVGATLTIPGSSLVIDGYTITSTDNVPLGTRILVKDQTDPTNISFSMSPQNGIYVLTQYGSDFQPFILTRSDDYDTTAEIQPGGVVSIHYGNMNGFTMWMNNNSNAPTIGTDGIWFYSFNQSSQGIQRPCRLATTENLDATYEQQDVTGTLQSNNNGSLIVDGVQTNINDRILVKNQNNYYENGIYFVLDAGSSTTQWLLERTFDYSSVGQIVAGGMVGVFSGTENSDTLWMQMNVVQSLGTSPINFSLISADSEQVNIEGVVNQIDVSNPMPSQYLIGIAENPAFPGNESITVPVGSTAQRPANPVIGMERFNTDV